MRKLLFTTLMSLLITSTILPTVIACSEDNDDIFLNIGDEVYNRGLIEDIAFDFMYYRLPKAEQSKAERDHFDTWEWSPKGLTTIYGRTRGSVMNGENILGYEYWELTIKKTKKKGLFIDWWDMHNSRPWPKNLM